MPLPKNNIDRELLHVRDIQCKGYKRSDGLWEIDAWLTDIKTYEFDNKDRNKIKAGEPLHAMGLRVTINDNMVIKECIAVTDFSPFNICNRITPSFKKLIGIKITHGFSSKVNKVVGGVNGCTHLVELLKPIATTAFQTLFGQRSKKIREGLKAGTIKKIPIINSCHAWSADGEIAKRELDETLKHP